MDGSSSSVGSMSSGTKSSRRPKIIGGIIGGAVGLVLLLLCIHCIVLAVRRKHRRQEAEGHMAYRDLEKDGHAEHTESGAEAGHAGPTRGMKPGTKPRPKNPKNLSVVTTRLRSMGPHLESRPLPQEPRSAPSLPAKLPYVGSRVEHETGYLSTANGPHSARVESGNSRQVGVYRKGSAAVPATPAMPAAAPAAPAASTSEDRSPRSPWILQTMGTPQPPQPRKIRDLRPNSDDPFM